MALFLASDRNGKAEYRNFERDYKISSPLKCSVAWNHAAAPLDEMRLYILHSAVIQGLKNRN